VPTYGVSFIPAANFELAPAGNVGRAVIVGIGDAATWLGAGTATVTLHSDAPFWYRLRDGGTLACQVGDRSSAGASADVGAFTIVRDQQIGFSAGEWNLAAVYVAADVRVLAELRGPNLVEEFGNGSLSQSWRMNAGQLLPGDYVLDIAEMVGSNEPVGIRAVRTIAVVLLHDLPDWPWTM
jgi:hypothetical protein